MLQRSAPRPFSIRLILKLPVPIGIGSRSDSYRMRNLYSSGLCFTHNVFPDFSLWSFSFQLLRSFQLSTSRPFCFRLIVKDSGLPDFPTFGLPDFFQFRWVQTGKEFHKNCAHIAAILLRFNGNPFKLRCRKMWYKFSLISLI